MDMRDHALELASQGFRVIPLHWPIVDTIDGVPLCSCGQECKSIGKHPLTRHGVTDASTSHSQVSGWWNEYPSANIGVATGYEFDVIDIDGPEGANALSRLFTEFGFPLYMASAATGRDGGGHLYTSGGGQQSWTGGFGGFPAHLDCKGRGGYVVAPPSLHASGKRYAWLFKPGEMLNGQVPWPEWHDKVRALYTAIGDGASGIPGGLIIRQPGGATSGRFADVVRERVRAEVTAAGEGSRWQTLAMTGIWACAGLILGGEMDRDDALDLCEDMAREIGLTALEVARVPRELDRAIANRTTPIASRALPVAGTSTPGQVPAAVPGVTGIPGEAGQDGSGDPGGLFGEAAELERQTNAARIRIMAHDAARRQIAAAALGTRRFAERLTLAELMARPVEHAQYRVEGLWPIGGRTMLAAQFKAGKTTMVGNIVRCLADSSRFLSRYQATAPLGSIALLDTEMSAGMLQTWLSAQGIENAEKVNVFPMRGALSGFDITDDLIRGHWVHELKAANTDVVLLDCLGPVLAACGLDESVNKDVGTFINAFEQLLAEAGVRESMIVHHMGHAGERSRGASRLRDWPDVEWHLIREGQEDDYAPSPNVPRYFRAYGRDVNAPEQLLSYEPNMRWLSVDGQGNRKDVRVNALSIKIIDYVVNHPGDSGRAITDAVGGRVQNARDALKSLVEAGTLVAIEGERRAIKYFHCDYQGTS